MEINDFVGIMIVGAGLSLVIQWFKNQFGTEAWVTRVSTLVLACVVGGAYVWLRSTEYFETIMLVLTTASAVYGLLIKQFESN